MRTHFYGPRDRSKTFHIPIYEFGLELVLCSCIKRAHNCPKRLKRLGGPKWKQDSVGLWCSRGYQGSLFLDRSAISHDLIAHETRHAVDDIMKTNLVNFGKDGDHETAALLQGYVTRLVYEQLKKWKIKIK